MGLFNKNKKKEENKLENVEETEDEDFEEPENNNVDEQDYNEIEEVDDFVTDEKPDDKEINEVIENYANNYGTEETINYLNSIITRLNVQLVLESLESNNFNTEETDSENKDDAQEEYELQE